MSREIHSYLRDLHGHLRMDPVAEREILREFETHLEDRLHDLRTTGLSREAAVARALRGFGEPRVLGRRLREARTAISWTSAFVAAAPFAGIGLLLATGLWRHPVPATAAAALVVIVTFYGLWQGRPVWFSPWAGTALTLLVLAGYFAFAGAQRSVTLLQRDGPEPLALAGFVGAGVYFPLAALILVSTMVVVVRRDWLEASVMLSPFVPVILWLAALHQAGGLVGAGIQDAAAPSRALGATFLTMALAAIVFARSRSRVARIATVVATVLVVLGAVSYEHDAGLLLPVVAGRVLVVLLFLLSPAVLDLLLNRKAAHLVGPLDDR